MTRADQRTELQNIIGADLEDDEANAFLYEGLVALCVRAEWTRKTVQLGPTVADQALYALPAEVDRPLKVYGNGLYLTPSDEKTVADIEAGYLNLRADGVWYLDYDEDGDVSVAIYPVPTSATAGGELRALVVYVPDEPTDSSALPIPLDFHRAPIVYAAAQSLGGSEDDLERRAAYMNDFESYVLGLRARRNSRTGSGPIQARLSIIGGTA